MGHVIRIPSVIVRLSVFLVAAACSACSTAAPRQTEYMESIPGLRLTINEMRVLLLDYHDYFSSRVATAAGLMYREQTDPQHRINSLTWRNNSVSAAQEFAFETDPLVGLVKLMVLSSRMRDYFEGPASEEIFGPPHGYALDVARDLRERGFELARRVSTAPDLEIRLQRVDSAAAADPLEGLSLLEGAVFAAPETFVTESGGGLRTLGSIEQTTRDLSERLNVYYRYLPRQLRWELELLVMETHNDFIDDAMSDVDEISSSLASVDARIGFVTDSLVAELLLVGDEMVARERAMILGDVDRQRLETIASLEEELELLLADVERQRTETLRAVDELVAGARTDAVTDVDRVLDRALARLARLAFGFLVALLVGAAVLIVLHNRTRPNSAAPRDG
jgi:hypothetical protein